MHANVYRKKLSLRTECPTEQIICKNTFKDVVRRSIFYLTTNLTLLRKIIIGFSCLSPNGLSKTKTRQKILLEKFESLTYNILRTLVGFRQFAIEPFTKRLMKLVKVSNP